MTILVGAAQEILRTKEYYERVMSIQSAYIYGYPMMENEGRRTVECSGKTFTLDVIYNGGFETAGGGGADVFAGWTEAAGDGTIIDDGAIFHGGAHACRLTAGPSINTYVRCSEPGLGDGAGTIRVKPGDTCVFSFWTRGDGTNAIRWSLYDVTNAIWLRTVVSTGISGVVYQQVTYTFAVPKNCWSIQFTFLCPITNGGIAYLDDVSLLVNSDLAGRYSTAGILYGQANFVPYRTSIHTDGADTHSLIGTQFFNNIANMNVGSWISWAITDNWADVATPRYQWHIKSSVDATWYLVQGKNNAFVNNIFWRRRTGAAVFEQTHSPFSPVGWYCMGMIWDVISAPKRIAGWVYTLASDTFLKVFDVAPGVGVGDANWDKAAYPVWDGNTMLLAGSAASQEHIGYASNHYYWPGIVLNDLEMAYVMRGALL